jgi:peptide/nickel transport system permease protein
VLRAALRLPIGAISFAVLVLLGLLAAFGPVLAPYDPLLDSQTVLAGPSWDHWLGTDYLGRDVLSRLLAGSPRSLFSAVEVVVVGLAVGVVPGLLSVFLGRRFEWVTLRLTDTIIALPFLVFAVAVTALVGNSMHAAMVTVGVIVAPAFLRISRAAALTVANTQYVEAATLVGASVPWIVRRHVWGKVLSPVAVTTASVLGVGLVVVSSLTFLGIGTQPPAPTWGGMLASDLGYLAQKPWAPLAPTVLIMAAVGACNGLADALKDVSGQTGRALLARRHPSDPVRVPTPA